jgi:sugar transferase EpsL
MKRCLDLALAGALLLCMMPILAAIAVAVRLVMGPPVLFIQERAGHGERAFRIYKFRTMRAATVESDRDAERITRLGSWLRRWSLDELPQLWNVVRGDMALVGPRPLPLRYLPRYTPAEARRHAVRPGLTGWAQVNGRNAQTWQERLLLDVWYVDHWSYWLDLKILGLTVMHVLSGRGVSQPGHATMEEFRGG